MEDQKAKILEGVFAVAKPAFVSSADVLQKLQRTFAASQTFAPLLHHQTKRPSKDDYNVFRMGHGGTLDPLGSGVLIVGIGRGTKQLQEYLACNKTYETVVLFGASTDTYDCTGTIQQRGSVNHVTRTLVEEKLKQFIGDIQQQPPIYSALKINGVKACEYARQGQELPRQLESREVHVKECTILEWYMQGQHGFSWPNEQAPAPAPALRIRLEASSGFYVSSFAHDLGIACQSNSHMTSLERTQQANFTIKDSSSNPALCGAITYADLDAGENAWGAKLRPQLEKWVEEHPAPENHVNGRDPQIKRKLEEDKAERPRQRFRGSWVADTKKKRTQQQGGKFKGKRNQNPPLEKSVTK